jgi:hypothetical protein
MMSFGLDHLAVATIVRSVFPCFSSRFVLEPSS